MLDVRQLLWYKSSISTRILTILTFLILMTITIIMRAEYTKTSQEDITLVNFVVTR